MFDTPLVRWRNADCSGRKRAGLSFCQNMSKMSWSRKQKGDFRMNVMFCTHIVRSQTLRVAQLTFRCRNGDTCTISFEKISFEVAQPRNQSDTEHLVSFIQYARKLLNFLFTLIADCCGHFLWPRIQQVELQRCTRFRLSNPNSLFSA